MIRELPIDQIDGRSDARQVDEATVGGLVDSIGTVGLINPIRVRVTVDRWEVIAGHHRLEASKRLGLAEITADIIESDDLHAELAMIDENLVRHELSASERAAILVRRRAVYNAIYNPLVGRGGDRKSDQVSEGQLIQTFAEHTAAATGMAPRTVYKQLERGEKVIAEAMGMIQGTKLDTTTYLDKIKGLRPNEQVAAVRRDLAHLRQQELQKRSGSARRIVKVDEALTDEEASEKQFAALVAAWNKAGETARQRFREEVVDAPVFDSGSFNSNPQPTSSPEAETPVPTTLPAEAATGAESSPSAPVDDFEPPAFLRKPERNERCMQPTSCKFATHPQKITCSDCSTAWAISQRKAAAKEGAAA